LKKTDLYLSIGSNLGNKEENLRLAIQQIDHLIGDIVQVSSFYNTPADGFNGDNFINACIYLQSTLNPNELINSILNIEYSLGRKRKNYNIYESRHIDIDIIFYGNLTLNTKKLIIPHPRMHIRHFVLIPLCNISKNIFHPIKKKTVHELLLDLPERLDIIKINP
jgi:2-amino-4-hydroxy-6-hydroxymethyldihydropteridine diphosphokinase